MKDFSDSKIYILHYKKGTVLKNDDFYQPVMSGNHFRKENSPFLGDDTGDNISDKNPFFSELTGLYWIWKNTNHKVTGVCHYRRFFTAQPEPFLYRFKRFLYFFVGLSDKRHGLIYTKNLNLFRSRILTKAELNLILKHYDAVLPQARKLKYSVEEHYRRYHDINDLKILKAILSEKYPEYLEAFTSVLEGNRLYANNIFILREISYQNFMHWWFDVIFEYERRVDFNRYSGYQKRVIGFIAERLLTVWFKKENLNCKELQLIYFKKLKYE